MAMVIYLGADHAGYALKEKLKLMLEKKHIGFDDCGTHSEADKVDYPDYAEMVAKSVLKNKGALGILVCGTGIGMCIAANKFKGIRAALCYNEFSAKMAREHNDANILCLGGRTMKPALASRIANAWLSTQFTNDDRHKRRLGKIAGLEKTRK